jgi:hypothetical protein
MKTGERPLNNKKQFKHMRGIFVILVLLIMNLVPILNSQPAIQEQSREMQGRSDLINISGWMGENGWYRGGVMIAIHPPEGAGPVFYQINDMGWSMYMTPVIIDSDGWFTFSCFYMDAQGNQSEIYTVCFGIDKTPPVVHLVIQKIDWFRYQIILECYENMSGVVSVELYIDDVLIGEYTTAPYDFIVDIRMVRNCVVEFVVYDAAGNNGSAVHIFPYAVSCVCSYPRGIFHLQYVLTTCWDANQTYAPISNGETREVNITVQSMVTRGAFGKILLRLLEGSPYNIHLSVTDTPEWCEPYFTLENLTATVHSDEIEISETSLCIHVLEDAPGNYSEGWVKCRAWVESMTGPFRFFALIHGFKQNFTVSFVNAP